MQAREDVGEPPVDFLRKGPLSVTGSQSSLDVTKPDLVVERHHRCDEDAGRISLRQNPVGIDLAHNRVGRGKEAGGQLREALIGSHQIHLVVGRDLKEVEHLIQHLAMLPRRTDDRAHTIGISPQLLDNGRHLDRFRARAEDAEDRQFMRGSGQCGQPFARFCRQILPYSHPSKLTATTSNCGCFNSSSWIAFFTPG